MLLDQSMLVTSFSFGAKAIHIDFFGIDYTLLSLVVLWVKRCERK